MWAIVQNNTVVEIVTAPRAVTINGTQYPETVFRQDLATMRNIGIYPVQQAARPDPRFYVFSQAGWTIEADRVVENLNVVDRLADQIKSELKAAVSAIHGELKAKDKTVTIRGTQYLIAIDSVSTGNITAMTAAATSGVFPANFVWRMVDNTEVPLNATEMVALGAEVMTYIYATYRAMWDHKTAIDALVTNEELRAYDINANWPSPT